MKLKKLFGWQLDDPVLKVGVRFKLPKSDVGYTGKLFRVTFVSSTTKLVICVDEWEKARDSVPPITYAFHPDHLLKNAKIISDEVENEVDDIDWDNW